MLAFREGLKAALILGSVLSVVCRVGRPEPGTTFGTLNWLMRTLTGALFTVACVWLAYSYLGQGFTRVRRQVESKRRRISAPSARFPISANQRGG